MYNRPTSIAWLDQRLTVALGLGALGGQVALGGGAGVVQRVVSAGVGRWPSSSSSHWRRGRKLVVLGASWKWTPWGVLLMLQTGRRGKRSALVDDRAGVTRIALLHCLSSRASLSHHVLGWKWLAVLGWNVRGSVERLGSHVIRNLGVAHARDHGPPVHALGAIVRVAKVLGRVIVAVDRVVDSWLHWNSRIGQASSGLEKVLMIMIGRNYDQQLKLHVSLLLQLCVCDHDYYY